MSLKDKIEALGESIGEDLKAVLHELAVLAGAAAPVAEAIEAVVAPEDVAATVAAASVAEEVANVTADSSLTTVNVSGPTGASAVPTTPGANGPSA